METQAYFIFGCILALVDFLFLLNHSIGKMQTSLSTMHSSAETMKQTCPKALTVGHVKKHTAPTKQ